MSVREVVPNSVHPPKGRAEYDVLVQALDRFRPRCRDYEVFTADRNSPAELAFMSRLCGECPLRSVCRSYADAANPSAGYWAGQRYPRKDQP